MANQSVPNSTNWPHEWTGVIAFPEGGRVGANIDSVDSVDVPLCLEAHTAASRGSFGYAPAIFFATVELFRLRDMEFMKIPGMFGEEVKNSVHSKWVCCGWNAFAHEARFVILRTHGANARI